MTPPPAEPRPRYGLLQAGIVFVLLIVALYYLVSLLDDAVLEPTAQACGWLLARIGQDVAVYGPLIRSAETRFEIVGECTAVFPAVLLVSGVLAFPSSARAKLLGALLFLPAVLLLNQLRLVTLWFVQRHAPHAFDLVHVYVWQPLMVVLVVAMFAVWLDRMVPKAKPGDAAAR